MRLAWLALTIIVTAYGFFPMTETNSAGISHATAMDMPVLCMASESTCWLTLGAGQGVVVIGAVGWGVVCFTLYGAGILFATGQLAFGGIAIGQAGGALSLFLGQVGGAFTTIAQGALGVISRGQAAIGFDGQPFFESLYDELRGILRFRAAPYPDELPD